MGRNTFVMSWIAGAVLIASAAARGEDFHVESRVFKIGETQPMLITTTLFINGVVYDFMTPAGGEDAEATILDPQRQRFVVLDPKRKICTEVTLEQVKEFNRLLRLEAAGAQDAILNFLSNPQFTEKADGDVLEFTSSWMNYKLKTTPAKSADVARQYAEFSFWHGQLNVMINPNSLPPFGRMTVSEKLEERNLLPLEVSMTVAPKNPQQKLTLRAEHRFQWTILDSDRKKIDEAHNQIKLFQPVSLKEYNRQRADAVEKPTATTATKPAEKSVKR